jgi:hypothetical protein
MGDFLQLRVGPAGDAAVVYADSNNRNGVQPGLNDPNGGQVAHPMFVRQIGGTSVLSSRPLVHGHPRPTSSARDASGDARLAVGGRVGRNRPNLDFLRSRISKLDGTHYRITLTVADLRSLAPGRSQTSDKHLVWLVQWLSPSRSDPKGGGNYFAYMESENGKHPSFWTGESGATNYAGLSGFTYPGTRRVPGSYVAAAPGTISIDVPIATVRTREPVSRTLFHVTAASMTLAASAHDPLLANGVGGSFFDLVDVVPAFDYVP